MGWKDINLTNFKVAAAPYGGPIGEDINETLHVILYLKSRANENASRRKFELASRLNTNLRWLALTLNRLKFLRKFRRLAINLRVLANCLNGTNASYRKLPQVNLRWLAFSFELGFIHIDISFKCTDSYITIYNITIYVCKPNFVHIPSLDTW
jgi:hypothetical protein